MSEDRIAWFNRLPREQAERELYACFASRTWASGVAAHRPFADSEALFAAADAAWSELTQAEWLAAFAAHPRIGESGGRSPSSSEQEQLAASQASKETLAELATENRRYETRFGHVFLISASGRTGEDILAELRQRLRNTPATELRIAAEEQRKITRLRLERRLHS